MKLYQLFFTILALMLGLAACAGSNDDDKSKKSDKPDAAPKLSAEEVKKKVTEAYDNLNKNVDDVRANPDKYKEYLENIAAHPEESLEKAGLGALLKPDSVSIPGGIALIGIGLFLTVMGRRLFKLFLGISGFIVGGSVFLYLLIQIETFFHLACPRWGFWLIGLVGGFLGSAVFNKLWKWAVYGMSAYGGVMLGFWILGMLNGTSLNQYIERTTFLVIFGIVGLFSAHFVDEFVVISSSSLMGALTAVFGYDMLHCVGFRVFCKNTFDNTPTNIVDFLLEQKYSNNIRYCMIAVLFVTVSGIYIQYRYQPRTYDSD